MEHFGVRNRAKYEALSTRQLELLKLILESQKRNLLFKNQFNHGIELMAENGSDEVDQATIDYNNAQNLRFRKRDNFYEKKIDESLERIKRNEYGFCRDCYRPIHFTRLKARPTAELCIICKEESERDEQKSYIASKSCVRLVNLAREF